MMCGPPSLASMGICTSQEEVEYGSAHVSTERSAPEPDPPGDAADAGGLRGMPDSCVRVGSSAALPDLRPRGVLRLFPAAACPRSRLRHWAPDRPVVRAG